MAFELNNQRIKNRKQTKLGGMNTYFHIDIDSRIFYTCILQQVKWQITTW